jgi:hypothetical protein
MVARFLLFVSFLGCSVAVKAQIVINEVCPANGDINYDPQFFNFSGWVELHNTSGSSISVSGYYLSDDEGQPAKWRVPSNTSIAANGYLLIWCDGHNSGLHTNFSLNCDGESVILSNSSQVKKDKIIFPKQYTNVSYGRTVDGGPEVKFLLRPSPGTKNNPDIGDQRLDNPTISVKAGRYASAQNVTITHPEPNVQIRYTLNGAEPENQSFLYTGAINISATSTLKAKAFKTAFIPSKTEVQTYFINEHTFSLPVISISTNQSYLWDNTIGIYTDGTNGITGNCRDTPFNWNQDWDRHAQVEFFGKDGSKTFDQPVDLRIGGACSRGNPQKSLVVKARSKYGKNTIDEKLFATKESSSYGGFILRNSGNDFWSTMFRDAVLQAIPVGQMDIDYMAYEPKIFYLNGNYWGIQNLREKIDADYFKANYGVEAGDLDLGEWTIALEGSVDGFTNYVNALQGMDLTKPAAFEYIDNNIDVQEYINYVTTEIYYCNTDWPGNNVKYWRQRSTNGKWRWVLWDIDFGFALYEGTSYATHPTLQFATEPNGPGWPNPPWSTLHLRLLLQNPEFRSRFVQTLTTSLSTTFEPNRVKGFIDSFQNRIKTEIPFHLSRWGLNFDYWNSEVERMRNFAVQRNDFMKSYIGQFFGLSDRVTLNFSPTPVNGGKISINGIATDQTVSCDYFKGLPFTIKALPATGYRFKQWNISKREVEQVSFIDRAADWKYFDQGYKPDSLWAANQYDDKGWSHGPARLGYGEGTEQTMVGYGPNPEEKFVTTYFRKSFDVADTTGLQSLVGQVLYDDGVVMYLNGQEIFRSNMPAGEIRDTTLSSNFTAEENVYVPFYIPRGVIRPGSNLIAVEIHQVNRFTSDMSFDLELRSIMSGNFVDFSSSETSYSDNADSNFSIEAVFEAITAVDGIVINEFSAVGSNLKDENGEEDDWIELYNKGTEPVDVAGFYITDNLTNKTKYQIKADANHKTVIAPGAYAILWADEELTEGPLHVNFKLSSDGESIGLYQKAGDDLLVVDEVTFTNQTEGRLPNATGPFSSNAMPTPLAKNEVWTATDPEFITSIGLYPNPTSGNLMVRCSETVERIAIHNSSGIEVANYAELVDGDVISMNNLPGGIYIAILKTSDRVVTSRIVKID